MTAENVTVAQADLAALEALDQQQEGAKGDAQQATRDRNAERRALADYQKIARVALADQPDLLEPLGLLARS